MSAGRLHETYKKHRMLRSRSSKRPLKTVKLENGELTTTEAQRQPRWQKTLLQSGCRHIAFGPCLAHLCSAVLRLPRRRQRGLFFSVFLQRYHLTKCAVSICCMLSCGKQVAWWEPLRLVMFVAECTLRKSGLGGGKEVGKLTSSKVKAKFKMAMRHVVCCCRSHGQNTSNDFEKSATRNTALTFLHGF